MKDDISNGMTGTETIGETGQPAEIPSGEAQSEEPSSGGQTGSPRRYKLYDKFADHVSLRTIDTVILITAVLIIVLLIYGIATGGAH